MRPLTSEITASKADVFGTIFSYSIPLFDIDIFRIAIAQQFAEQEYSKYEAKVLIRLHFELFGTNFALSE
jgi:hypothetical protein